MNEGMTTLGRCAFKCSTIKNIKLPSTLKRIESRIFEDCTNLKSLVIPNGVECIGEECFEHSGIEEITLPGTLKEIDKDAFKGCDNLKTVWIENGFALDLKNIVNSSVKILPSK